MNLIEALSVFGMSSLSAETHVSLKRRYRKLAKEKHPDRTGGGSEEFIALQEAYVALKREVKDTGEESTSSNPEDQKPNTTQRTYTSAAVEDDKPSKSKGYVVVDQEDIEKMNQEVEPAEVISTELQALSKDELLEKYYSDTQNLNQKIGSLVSNHELHRNVLATVEGEVSRLSDDYRQQMNRLQSKYQKEIEKLERNAAYRFWIKYFVSPLTGKDIWAKYQDNVATYEAERKQTKAQFNDKLLLIYGESLNEMSKYLTSSNSN
jgi:curved DNA-binding protein CbpA